MKNSNEEELKREKRSLLGKIDRRHTTILFAKKDISDYRFRLQVIESQLAEFKSVKR